MLRYSGVISNRYLLADTETVQINFFHKMIYYHSGDFDTPQEEHEGEAMIVKHVSY